MPVQDYELLLKIRADMAQAVEQLNQVQAALRKTSEAGTGAGGGMNAAGAAAHDLGEKLKVIPGLTQQIQFGFHDLRNILVGAFAIREIADFTGSLVNANVEAQRIQYTLEQAFGKDGAAQQFQFVTAQAQQLGLNLKDAAEGYAQMATSAQGTGLQTKDLQKLFIGLSEAATVLHSSTADVNGVMVQLAQGMSLGKLQMQDIRAIAQHLPGTMTLVSEAAHRMGTDFQTALKSGGIPAIQFLGQFADVLHERFGGQAVEASHSLNAELNRLKTVLFEATTQGNDFGDAFAGALRSLTAALSDPSVEQGLGSVISGLGKIVALTIKAGGEMAHLASEIGQGLGIAMANLTTGGIDPGDQLGLARHNLQGINTELSQLQQYQAEMAKPQGERGAVADEVIRRMLGLGYDTQITPALIQSAIEARTLQQKNYIEAIHNLETAPHPKFTAGGGSGALAPILGKIIPTSGGTAARADAAASKLAREAASAQKELTQSLINLQGQLDPTAAIWAKYNAAVEKANEDATKAKLAHGANAQAIDAQKNAVIQLAAQVRDAALDKQAEQARQQWEALKRSFETPAQVAVDNALKKIAELNALLAKGVIDSAEYHDALAKIGVASVNKPPPYKGPDAAVSGAFGELQKNTKALDSLEAWHQAVLDANTAFHAKDAAEQVAYQARMAAVEKYYASQRVEIEKARGLLTLQAAQETFAQLASLTSSNNKALAAIGRVAAILQAGYSIAINVAKASEVGFPFNIPFIAGAIAQGAQIYDLITQAASGGGFAVGGYTGNAPWTQPVGVVHGGEGVLSAPEVRSIGGETGFNMLRAAIANGFADGGLVNDFTMPNAYDLGYRPPPRFRLPSPVTTAATAAAPQVNIKHITLLDPEFLAGEIMDTPKGTKIIINKVGEHPRAIKGRWES